MSDTDNAQAGAQVAPVENVAADQQQPNQQAEGSQSTDEQDAAKQQQERDEKGRFSAQGRINELTRLRREAERERDFYRQQYEAANRQQPQQQQRSAQDEPPAIENFQTVQEWGRALAEYSAKQALSQAEQRFSQHDQQRQQDTLRQSFEQKEAAYAATAPDYYDRVNELTSVVRFGPEVLEVLATSEHGPAVTHYLANHLDEADRLSRLPPHVAAVQIGRIEAQVSAPKKPPVSNAPNPAPKVGGASAAPRGLSDDISIEEWMKRRTAKS